MRQGSGWLLKFFDVSGRFPASRVEVPVEAAAFVADQLGVDFEAFARYGFVSRTAKRHRAQIRGCHRVSVWRTSDGSGS